MSHSKKRMQDKTLIEIKAWLKNYIISVLDKSSRERGIKGLCIERKSSSRLSQASALPSSTSDSHAPLLYQWLHHPRSWTSPATPMTNQSITESCPLNLLNVLGICPFLSITSVSTLIPDTRVLPLEYDRSLLTHSDKPPLPPPITCSAHRSQSHLYKMETFYHSCWVHEPRTCPCSQSMAEIHPAALRAVSTMALPASPAPLPPSVTTTSSGHPSTPSRPGSSPTSGRSSAPAISWTWTAYLRLCLTKANSCFRSQLTCHLVGKAFCDLPF